MRKIIEDWKRCGSERPLSVFFLVSLLITIVPVFINTNNNLGWYFGLLFYVLIWSICPIIGPLISDVSLCVMWFYALFIVNHSNYEPGRYLYYFFFILWGLIYAVPRIYHFFSLIKQHTKIQISNFLILLFSVSVMFLSTITACIINNICYEINTKNKYESEISDTSKISVEQLTDYVEAGSYASIKIKGEPHTDYNISVTYDSGESDAQGLYQKTSDKNGYVSWSWKVGTRTTSGTYPIHIFSNTDSIKVYFEVY